MYHTNEILNMSNISLKENKYSNEQSVDVNKLITKKVRFGELDIGNIFVFNGKIIKKTGDLTAESDVKRGKQQFVFFKNNLVKSIVECNSKDSCLSDLPTFINPILKSTDELKKLKKVFDDVGYDLLFNTDNLPSFVGKEEKTTVLENEEQIEIVLAFKSIENNIVATATINGEKVGESIVKLSNSGYINGTVNLGNFNADEYIINQNYIIFYDTCCHFYIDDRYQAGRQSGIKKDDTLTICLKLKNIKS